MKNSRVILPCCLRQECVFFFLSLPLLPVLLKARPLSSSFLSLALSFSSRPALLRVAPRLIHARSFQLRRRGYLRLRDP